MNSEIIGRVARFIVNFCDWMNGYHGKLLEDVIKTFIMSAPLLWLFLYFAIKLS